MEKLLLKPTEAAEAIGLGRSKTYQLISSGAIPSVRIGKSVRVPVVALRSWIEKQLQEQIELQGDNA
jgi:excisionase family DNA binding protein